MHKRRLNIVMLTTVRFHQSKGGTEKVMIETANAMVKRGHKVTIIFRDKNGSKPGFELDSTVNLLNCASVKTPFLYQRAICDLRAFSFSRRVRNQKATLLNLRTVAFRYMEAIHSTPADIYITYDPKLSAMLVSEFAVQQPVITTMQFDPSHIIRRYYFDAIKDLIVRAGPIQVLTPAFIQTIRSVLPASKCISIPNVVKPIAEEASLESPVILNVGRVMSLKNQELIIEAFGMLSKKYPTWKVKIFGETNVDTTYTKKVRTAIEKAKLEKVVEIGEVSNNIEKELLSASIFAFPSTSEGFSLALTEAMSAGLPCIGLKSCPGVSYLIKNGENGLLCDNTPESLASCIEKLILNKELRKKLGKAARSAMRQYAPERIWDLWEKLLFSLV